MERPNVPKAARLFGLMMRMSLHKECASLSINPSNFIHSLNHMFTSTAMMIGKYKIFMEEHICVLVGAIFQDEAAFIGLREQSDLFRDTEVPGNVSDFKFHVPFKRFPSHHFYPNVNKTKERKENVM